MPGNDSVALSIDSKPTVSYTLQWSEFGRESYQSLGPHATLASAKEAAQRKEAELNSFERQAGLDPLSCGDFVRSFLRRRFHPPHLHQFFFSGVFDDRLFGR